MPAQVNAELVKVVGAGVAEDWDRVGQAGAVKFTGSIPAYLRERVDRVSDGQTVNILERRTVWIDTADARALGIDTDDVVTIRARGQEYTASAVAVARSELDGLSRFIQTTRIDLGDA